jgi:hypothetical protein
MGIVKSDRKSKALILKHPSANPLDASQSRRNVLLYTGETARHTINRSPCATQASTSVKDIGACDVPLDECSPPYPIRLM